ncbi:uncharacterized protein ACN2A1_014918 [Glossina fuscipes fuscipes]
MQHDRDTFALKTLSPHFFEQRFKGYFDGKLLMIKWTTLTPQLKLFALSNQSLHPKNIYIVINLIQIKLQKYGKKIRKSKGNGGYAGVAIYSKIMRINVEYGSGNDEFDGNDRVITAEYEKFFLIHVVRSLLGQGRNAATPRQFISNEIFWILGDDLKFLYFVFLGISDLDVAALATMYPVAKGVVLAVRTAAVLSSVFAWACIDELIAVGSDVGEILGTADARVPLAAAVAVGVLILLPNFTELPATVNTAPFFARQSIPRVKGLIAYLHLHRYATFAILCCAVYHSNCVASRLRVCYVGNEPDEIFADDASGSTGVHDACCRWAANGEGGYHGSHEWEKLFQTSVQKHDDRKSIIIRDDMNVAHAEIDLGNPKTNTLNAGFTKEEREKMPELLALGYINTFKHFYPERKAAYTFWAYMGGARACSVGLRLDYCLVSQRFLKKVVDSCIRSQCVGSGHCPITLFLKS